MTALHLLDADRILTGISEKFIMDYIRSIRPDGRSQSPVQSQQYYDALYRQVCQRIGESAALQKDSLPEQLVRLAHFLRFFEPAGESCDVVKAWLMEIETDPCAGQQGTALLIDGIRQYLPTSHSRQYESDTTRGVKARDHCEQVMARRSSQYLASFSPAGRSYILLQTLRTGRFGRVVSRAGQAQKQSLLSGLRQHIVMQLADDINSPALVRHSYHDWIGDQASPDKAYHALLTWLGDGCEGHEHPVSFSVTQSGQPVALGMPRLCSAQRLGDALVDELFGQD